jgi:hypothetical protein
MLAIFGCCDKVYSCADDYAGQSEEWGLKNRTSGLAE